ncbi:hypothetical protein DH2020_038314 [Rehmannia glutinosa]|uniref:Pentatricopeptide repeat-containing protein n=1 Tax=Rehmannia glutinosa TaxID=99300 RepID=A0ABR0UZ45_REHGL
MNAVKALQLDINEALQLGMNLRRATLTSLGGVGMELNTEVILNSTPDTDLHMSKALLALIKPRHHPQPKTKPPTKFFITPHIRKLANEICEIIRTQEKQWEETLQNRFSEEEIAPSEVAHLVFDKIRDCELGLKFFGFVSQNSFSLDGFAYSSLLKLLARSKLFKEIDNVLLDCMQCEEKLPTREALDVVIRAYADSGLVSKALDLYSFVLNNFNVVPNLSACNSLLNGLVKDENMKAAWHVYDEMVKRDDGGENRCLDNYSVCIMVKGLCKEGKVEKGRGLIEKRWGKDCIPNLVFYNTLIDGYCKRGDVKRAYGLLEDLKVKGFLPTQETYGALISGFCKRGDFKKVDEILNEMESSGLEINVQVYNNVVDAKYKFGLVGEALETTRKMIKDGYNLDIVTYNTLISNACRDGKVQEAEKLLKEVTNSGLVPNKLSFTPLIHAYCREGDFDRASSLLVEMTECGHKPDLITYGGLIHGLVVAGEVDAALTIRSKMMERGVSPDTCIYNILMNGLCKKGKFADAKQLLIEMLGLNVSPDAYVYATLVDGYIRSGNFDDAKKLFDDIIERGVDPGLVGYNAMIKGHCKLGMMKDAVVCIDKMTKRNISPDEFTYSTIIDGYVKQNDLYGALAMFCHALKQNFAPNIVTCTSLISGFCRFGDVDGAETFFKGMRSSRIQPNVVTYTVLIGSCCKEGKIAKASSFFEEMLMSKCNPNDITFHYLVNGLSNEVPCAIARTTSESDPYKLMLLDIFGRMVSDGWQPISAAYVSIIACLCLNRMLGSALQLTDKILNKGFSLDSVILAALLHGICSVGKSKEWRNIITYKLIEPKIDVALKYLSIFGRYSTREVTTEASLVLHTLLKEMRI